jgi:hypothetical protein
MSLDEERPKWVVKKHGPRLNPKYDANKVEARILAWFAKLWVVLTMSRDRRGPVQKCIDILKRSGSQHDWQHEEVRHWFSAMKASVARGTRHYPEECPEEVRRYEAAPGTVTPVSQVSTTPVNHLDQMGTGPRELADDREIVRRYETPALRLSTGDRSQHRRAVTTPEILGPTPPAANPCEIGVENDPRWLDPYFDVLPPSRVNPFGDPFLEVPWDDSIWTDHCHPADLAY